LADDVDLSRILICVEWESFIQIKPS